MRDFELLPWQPSDMVAGDGVLSKEIWGWRNEVARSLLRGVVYRPPIDSHKYRRKSC
ncbi:MAG: hypothetical protein KME55_29030 [Nostoc indistinguendum CM1-VF10]|jgi:hypothetical protein|nr:hypothetical protein [Nostoc indistinguendum CM1-VF10]